MEFIRLISKFHALGHMEKNQDQSFEWDVINAIKSVMDVFEAFEAGRRKINRSGDLNELLHWLDFAKNNVEAARNFFERKEAIANSKCKECGTSPMKHDEEVDWLECPICGYSHSLDV